MITPTLVLSTMPGSYGGPDGVAVDIYSNVYVADAGNNRVQKISNDTINVTTLAGGFNSPGGLVVDTSGNVFVVDAGNNKIRKITSTGVVTTFAGSGIAGSADGTGTAASFNNPFGIALDTSGNLYIAGRDDGKVRKITSSGVVTTLAGSGAGFFADGGSFSSPIGVAVDSSGNVYVADKGNNKIFKILQ